MHTYTIRPRHIIIGLFALCVASGLAQARPEQIDVKKLVKHITSYIETNPTDAEGYYTLARAHSLAYQTGYDRIAIVGNIKEPGTLPVVHHLALDAKALGKKAKTLKEKERAAHLNDAIKNFRTAIGINPKQARYVLGLAYFHESAMADGHMVPDGVPVENPLSAEEKNAWRNVAIQTGYSDGGVRSRAMEKLHAGGKRVQPLLYELMVIKNPIMNEYGKTLYTEVWREEAIAKYLSAYNTASTKGEQPKDDAAAAADDDVRYEAGAAFLRLVDGRGTRSDEEDKAVNTIKKVVTRLGKKRKGKHPRLVIPAERPAPPPALAPTMVSVNFSAGATPKTAPVEKTNVSVKTSGAPAGIMTASTNRPKTSVKTDEKPAEENDEPATKTEKVLTCLWWLTSTLLVAVALL